MKYKLKEHVTNEMLIACGFRIVFDKDIRAIRTLENCSIFIEHNGEVLAWQRKYIQYMIDLGYVEELE